MVRKPPASNPKASQKWKTKQTLNPQEQIEKIIEESKLITAQATQRAIEAIQAQHSILDPIANLPTKPASIFETPARGSGSNGLEGTGLTNTLKRLSFAGRADIEDSESKRNRFANYAISLIQYIKPSTF